MTCRLLSAALALAALPAFAQTARPELTVDLITQRPETWIGSWPGAPWWTDAGDAVYFDWNPGGAFDSDSLFRASNDPKERRTTNRRGFPLSASEIAAYHAESRDVRQVTQAERRDLAPRFRGWRADPGAYDQQQQRRLYERDGDIFLLNVATGAEVRLTRTRARESDPRWLQGDASLPIQLRAADAFSYRVGNDLFRQSVADGSVRQLTDLRSGREPSDDKLSAQDEYLADQQVRLFDVLRERARRDSLREVRREAQAKEPGTPSPYYVGDSRVGSLQVDPTGRFVTFQLSETGASESTLMVDYVTLSGSAEEMRARSKVGGEGSAPKLYVQDLLRDTTYAVDLTTLPGAFDAPDYKVALDPSATDSARVIFANGPTWSPDGRYAILDVRTRDNKDRWLATLDAFSGTVTSVDRQRDEAWVGGPGISSWGGGGDGGWLANTRLYWFQSERTGWSHIYTLNAETGMVTAMTSGAFEVADAVLAKDGLTMYFLSSEEDLGQRHVYRLDMRTGARERLTDGEGRWDFALSPAEDRLALLHSTASAPPDVYVQRIGQKAVQVTESPTAEWLAYPWRDAEIVMIPASDGAFVPARIYRPENPNGAAVLFVHGAGYLQNAHKWWSTYFREYQFHNLLADKGYVVLDVDYRASEGYGRDWRTAVYRHMGGRDLQDFVDASKWVGTEFGIDPERVGIYGGSYGGFITLMALFNEPQHFGAGAAMRSVTDWAHYNDGYTRNILNTPVDDPEAYARSSPIEFAAGLADPLLMTHGLVDDNVQPQDIFRLSQRLIELGKHDWELAIAPVEPHGYREASSWRDKLTRILGLFERTIGPDGTKAK